MLRRSGFLGVLVAIVALLAFQITPALAHHKEDHSQGGGKAKQASGKDANETGGASDGASKGGGSADDGIPDDNHDNLHPSGKDRETNDGATDDAQGNSTSDPDDDGRGPDRSNGGPDKPNGSGGEDLADQDGNNGCGNDDDFEDDNEGWCGGKPKPTPSPTAVAQVQGIVEEAQKGEKDDKDDVLGSGEETCPEVMGSKEACDEEVADEVKGVQHFAAPAVRAATAAVAGAAPAVGAATAAAGVLPFTGAALIPFAALGLALVGAGAALIARKR